MTAAAAAQAQHWINFSVGYHLYSDAYEAALADGAYVDPEIAALTDRLLV